LRVLERRHSQRRRSDRGACARREQRHTCGSRHARHPRLVGSFVAGTAGRAACRFLLGLQ
jgi:hypothetical protein